MVHIHHDHTLRARLIAHRDQVQQLIDRLGGGTDCGDLLADVVSGYTTLGSLCTELAVEHLREHVAEVEDAEARERGVLELEEILRIAFKK